MHEIELKFQVPARQRAALDRAVAGPAPMRRMRLQAAYVDTPGHALAAAGLALRLRREGRRWVQTLKGRTADAMTRLEHNVDRGRSAPMPAVDAGLHAGTPAGAALQTVLAAHPADALVVRYGTDIMRRTRVARVRSGRIELAFDVGRIAAAGRAIDVCELEIELLSGSPQAVLDAARSWVTRHGLWLDLRSKAERGDLLARGETVAPPVRAGAALLTPEMSRHAAWRCVLGACAEHVLANASQIASGQHQPEHVHQLRVGLRRLRSALRLFGVEGADLALAAPAAALFRRLGAARDMTVIETEFAADLAAALRHEGLEPGVGPPSSAANASSPAELVREPVHQVFLLDLLAALQRPPAVVRDPATRLRPWLAKRLSRWHRGVLHDAARFAELDDAALHRLRKRAKRLRYAAEFAAALFEPRALQRYLRVMDGLQDRLGAITDVLMAARTFRGADDPDPQRRFALRWLAARRGSLVRDARREVKAFRKVEPFWTD